MLLALALAYAHLAAPQATLPTGEELARQIRAADDALFATYFDACAPARLAAMVTPDIEMYHDRSGPLIGRDAFVATYRKQCETRTAPDAWRSRRVLVEASVHIDPVPGYGAIEEGDHRFYERKGNGPETLAGSAHFAQLWKWTPAGWQLARVLSYAHRAAEASPAP